MIPDLNSSQLQHATEAGGNNVSSYGVFYTKRLAITNTSFIMLIVNKY